MSCTASEYEVEGEFTEALAYDAEGHETEKYEDEEDDPAPDVCCNLCPEAVELRNLLILHLQENHTNCESKHQISRYFSLTSFHF